MRQIVPAWLLLLACAPGAAAQQPNPGSPSGIELADLQRAAVEADPRFHSLQLQTEQSALRLQNIDAERLPSATLEGQAQYQSDVPAPPLLAAGAAPQLLPAKDTYDASVRIDERLVDPTRGPRIEAERAQLAEAQALVRTSLFALRQEVNDAFFAAALLQERAAAVAATIADLEGRLRETTIRVNEGTALPSEAATVEATLLQRQQDDAELQSGRTAALARLAQLTGRSFAATDRLEIPRMETAVARARGTSATARTRPEYEQFARTDSLLARQQEVAAARDQPRVTAYARGGYGRPGLNFISNQFELYGLAGLRVEWNMWSWGATGREQEALGMQRQIVAADEAAFSRSVTRSTDTDLATIDRLTASLGLDLRIITLREQIERTTAVRFQERDVTAAEFLDRNTDLLQSRLAEAGHRVELAQASARFLTSLGQEVR